MSHFFTRNLKVCNKCGLDTVRDYQAGEIHPNCGGIFEVYTPPRAVMNQYKQRVEVCHFTKSPALPKIEAYFEPQAIELATLKREFPESYYSRYDKSPVTATSDAEYQAWKDAWIQKWTTWLEGLGARIKRVVR